ncbi:MAG TPA: hypothetical protein VH590_10770, partial [Ktedonobacterales bacterium]
AAIQARRQEQQVAPLQANGRKGQASLNKGNAVRQAGDVEAEISLAEQRVAALEELLAAASLEADVERITTLAEDYEREKARLAELYEEWAELSE